LGLWIWKAVECFKWGAKGYFSRDIEDFVSESDLNCTGLAQARGFSGEFQYVA
jgi:hypothetical protein